MSARLRRSTLAFFDMQRTHDPEDVDLANAGLYLVGAQVIACVLLLSVTATVASWVQPASQVSAVRSLAAATVLALLMLKAPLRVGSTRGVIVLFNALRPCAFLYITFLVVEQLLHSCETPTDEIPGHMTMRRIIFHGASLAMIGAALLRASAPTSENDLWFLITLSALLVIAIVPPPSLSPTGPLCGNPSAYDAGERLLRGLLFASCYVTSVYIKPPRFDVYDITISVIRCGATSIWVLGCSLVFVLFAPVQIGVAITARVRESNAAEAAYVEVADGASEGEPDLEAGALPLPPTALPLPQAEEGAETPERLVESIVRRNGFQELGLVPPPRDDNADGGLNPDEDYSGTPVDATQLSSLIGAPRLGV